MSTYNYASGAIHNDHHREVTINTSNTNIAALVNSFMAEDIQPVEEEKPAHESDHFPFLTKKCYEEKRVEYIDAEFRAACKGSAESLWRTLWSNENLGYAEVEPYDAATLYRGIEKWYGKLPYKERNFRDARNKR